ncbi:MAG: hypothetical protein JWR10_787 [Rubritepida sp.]|nr:hypothetical protein [Rubritepida sp.]
MTEHHEMQIDMVEVKAEDIIADHQVMYASFMKAATYAIGVVIVLLVALYLFAG